MVLAAAEVMLRRSCSKEALDAVPVRLTDMARNQKARISRIKLGISWASAMQHMSLSPLFYHYNPLTCKRCSSRERRTAKLQSEATRAIDQSLGNAHGPYSLWGGEGPSQCSQSLSHSSGRCIRQHPSECKQPLDNAQQLLDRRTQKASGYRHLCRAIQPCHKRAIQPCHKQACRYGHVCAGRRDSEKQSVSCVSI